MSSAVLGRWSKVFVLVSACLFCFAQLAVAEQEVATGADTDEREVDPGNDASDEVNPEESVAEESVAEESPKRNGPFFNIWEYRVHNNTLLNRKTIELALFSHLGANRNIDDIYDAADHLKEVYRSEGYPSVDVIVPPQDIVNGVVKFEVMEGKVSRLRVSGSRYFSLRKIKSEVESIQQGQPVHIPSFQEDVSQLNRKTPNLRVTPVFKQGRAPGTVEVDLRVRDKFPINSAVELNNYASRNTTDTRLSASFGYENLWLENHSWSLQLQTSPEDTDEVRVLATTYIFPANDSAKLAVYAVKSDSEISAIGDSVVIGSGEVFGVRYVVPLNSKRTYLHSISAGIDYKDFDETISVLGSDNPNDQGYSRPISYGSFTGLYNATFLGESDTTKLGFGVSFGIRNFPGGSGQEGFNKKRDDAKSNFIHLQAKVDRQDRFDSGWRLNTRSKIQLADSSLISNEQFSAGGNSSVRGYYESQQLGDDGITASVEIETKSYADWFPGIANEFRLRSFLDAAYLIIRDELVSEGITVGTKDAEYSIHSVGLGATLTGVGGFETVIDIGYPLKDSGDVDEGDIKVHALIKYEF
ncbi:MAG: hypothetical protein MI976_19450 [Pseudomonadales bacterium]|nr:hypothetical protein [Pseudomonadales bacterium]